jgi:ArsR family transcriptional regulator
VILCSIRSIVKTRPVPPSALADEALELIAARFRVLGEPNRLRLIRTLEAGERNVTELVEATGLTQANVSRHLQALTDAGVLGRRKAGVNVIYFIADPAIFELCDLVCGSVQKRLAAHARALAPRSA